MFLPKALALSVVLLLLFNGTARGVGPPSYSSSEAAAMLEIPVITKVLRELDRRYCIDQCSAWIAGYDGFFKEGLTQPNGRIYSLHAYWNGTFAVTELVGWWHLEVRVIVSGSWEAIIQQLTCPLE